MKPRSASLCLLVLAGIPLSAQELQVTTDHENRTYALFWESIPNRTYFLQVSDSLDDWEYCAEVFYGDGGIMGRNAEIGTDDHLFFRLVFTDEEVVGNDAEAADFDGDGLTNLDEIAIHGTDPFRRDSDRDWLSDFDEVTWNLSDPRNGDSDGDGLNDGQEDFDNDGWVNYLKLAMVSPPTNPATAAYAPQYLMVGSPGALRPALRFRNHPGSAHGYHYRVQASANLFTWTGLNHYENGFGPGLPPGVLGTADSVPANDGTGAEWFTVQAPDSSTPYLRLAINAPFPGYDLRTAAVTPETLRAHSDAHFDRLIPNN